VSHPFEGFSPFWPFELDLKFPKAKDAHIFAFSQALFDFLEQGVNNFSRPFPA